ncbi:hypothetical protein GBA65_22055 (plasmid) [Rubrobacter marinus]|uniref:Restriction endonuclease type IV Mrr domain-containing protein n=1 Tax=Rubrobacter marinus TaxID=2653852 RepID=A0A6G8Q3V7_9ACTN|nr:restriction endonuclease [Rubrobacter marinus]QIN81120.1 hypothetical protein GBA65_22055 [Rubrobacter marinus]
MAGKKKGRKATSKEKGDIVERVVQMMHRKPGLKVLRDQKLPAADGSGRIRQFDVVVLGTFAGYETVLLIECKNYGRNINVKDVDAFYGELQDVGYGPRQGVLVSAGTIGAGAQSRARSLGLKIFELKGLTEDRLDPVVHEAKQRIVFAVLGISRLVVSSEAEGPLEVAETMVFYDGEGEPMGVLPDLVWLAWLHGVPPSKLGERTLTLEADGWHHRAGDRLVPVLSAEATVEVRGAVVVLPGTATHHSLVVPETGATQKLKASARFDVAPGQYPVREFSGEEDLAAFLEADRAAVSLTVERVRAPRVRMGHVYWPPSQRVWERMHELQAAFEAGDGPPPSPDSLDGIEGSELNEVWEPVSPQYLMRAEREEGEDGP